LRGGADPIGDVARLAVVFGRKLEELGFAYVIGGSFASSVYGDPRMTNDIDIVVDLTPAAVPRLIAMLGDDYYHDEDRMRAVARDGGSFNVVHFDSGVKIDIFVPRGRSASRAFTHRTSIRMAPDATEAIWVAGPALIVIEKLRWFQKQDGASDRQWRDILGVLKGAREGLDLAWLRSEARADGTGELLERALAQAGLA
jgi:hypothetical protein